MTLIEQMTYRFRSVDNNIHKYVELNKKFNAAEREYAEHHIAENYEKMIACGNAQAAKEKDIKLSIIKLADYLGFNHNFGINVSEYISAFIEMEQAFMPAYNQLQSEVASNTKYLYSRRETLEA